MAINKKKILYLTSVYYPTRVGGAEIIVQVLAESMVRLGYDVVVISTSHNQGVNFQIVAGVKVYYVGIKNLYWPYEKKHQGVLAKFFWHLFDIYNLFMLKAVAQIIEEENPSLIHSHTLAGFSVAVWRYAKSRNIPVVHTLHDYYLLCPKSSMFKNNRNCEQQCSACGLYSVVKNRLSNLVDAVVGVSDFVLKRHLQFGYFKNVKIQRVIENGVVLPKYDAIDISPKSQNALTLGYIGRLESSKGIEQLLKTLTTFESVPWKLFIAGTGKSDYVDFLQKNYKLDNIQYLGYVKPQELFSKIDLLIVPSLWHEPFGLVVLESFLHGIPVIGSARGALPELIHDHKSGFIYEPLDAESLKGILRRLYAESNRIDEMKKYLLKQSGDSSADNMVGEYLNLYMEMINA